MNTKKLRVIPFLLLLVATLFFVNLNTYCTPNTLIFRITSSSQDGFVYSMNENYTQARIEPYEVAVYGELLVGQMYDSGTNTYYVFRSMLEFDTSSLPAEAIIVNARLWLKGFARYNDTDFLIRVQKWTGETPITLDDFNAYDGINYDAGNFSASNVIIDDWNCICLSNLSIIVKGGITRLIIMSSRDLNSIQPSGLEYVSFYSYDTVGIGAYGILQFNGVEPTLEVEAYLPLTATISPAGNIALLPNVPIVFTVTVSGGEPPLTYYWYVNETDQNVNSSTFTFSSSVIGLHLIRCKVEDSVGQFCETNTVKCFVTSENLTVTRRFNITVSDWDGWIRGYHSNYQTARTTPYMASTTAGLTVGQAPGYNIWRTVLKFNTTTLPLGCNVNYAKLYLYYDSDYSTTDFYIRVQKWTDDTPINLLDYNMYDNINYDLGNFSTQNYVVGWNVIHIVNTSVITKNGYTKLMLRSSRDIDANAPTTNEYVVFKSYDTSPSQSPFLEVEVTLPIAPISGEITPSSVNIPRNSTQTFTCNPFGGTPPYTYTWYVNNQMQPNITSNTFTFRTEQLGEYTIRCLITDSRGETGFSDIAYCNVVPDPMSVTISPSCLILSTNDTFTLTSTVVGGAPPLQYKWFRNGVLLQTQTSQLQISGSSWGVGVYDVHLNVTDSRGVEVKSNIAKIYVFPASPPETTRDWVTPNFNYRRSGNTPCYAPTMKLLRWNLTLQAYSASSPIIVNSTVFVVANDKFATVNLETGEIEWQIPLSTSYTYYSPSYYNGMVVFGASGSDYKIIAINTSSRQIQWQFQTSWIVNDPPAIHNNAVYALDLNSHLYGIHLTNGSAFMDYNFGVYWCQKSPIAVENEMLYFVWQNYLIAFNVNTQNVAWNYSFSAIQSSPPPPAVINGVVYQLHNHQIYAFNASNGQFIWVSPSISANRGLAIQGNVIYVAGDGGLYAVSAATGSVLWNNPLGYVRSVPVAAKNGVVYVGTSAPAFYAVASDGTILWSHNTEYYVDGCPAIVDGYVAFLDGMLVYAFWQPPPVNLTVSCIPELHATIKIDGTTYNTPFTVTLPQTNHTITVQYLAYHEQRHYIFKNMTVDSQIYNIPTIELALTKDTQITIRYNPFDISSPSYPTYFYSGFESEILQEWDALSDSAASRSSFSYHGNYSLMLSGDNEIAASILKRYPFEQGRKYCIHFMFYAEPYEMNENATYARWWDELGGFSSLYEHTFPLSAPTCAYIRLYKPENSSNLYFWLVYYYDDWYYEHVETSYTLQYNRWYNIKLETYIHESYGYVSLYVDGQQIASLQNICTTPFAYIELGCYSHTPPSNYSGVDAFRTIYLDEVYLTETTMPPLTKNYAFILPSNTTLKRNEQLTLTVKRGGGSSPYYYIWFVNGEVVQSGIDDTFTFSSSELGVFDVNVLVIDVSERKAVTNTVVLRVASYRLIHLFFSPFGIYGRSTILSYDVSSDGANRILLGCPGQTRSIRFKNWHYVFFIRQDSSNTFRLYVTASKDGLNWSQPISISPSIEYYSSDIYQLFDISKLSNDTFIYVIGRYTTLIYRIGRFTETGSIQMLTDAQNWVLQNVGGHTFSVFKGILNVKVDKTGYLWVSVTCQKADGWYIGILLRFQLVDNQLVLSQGFPVLAPPRTDGGFWEASNIYGLQLYTFDDKVFVQCSYAPFNAGEYLYMLETAIFNSSGHYMRLRNWDEYVPNADEYHIESSYSDVGMTGTAETVYAPRKIRMYYGRGNATYALWLQTEDITSHSFTTLEILKGELFSPEYWEITRCSFYAVSGRASPTAILWVDHTKTKIRYTLGTNIYEYRLQPYENFISFACVSNFESGSLEYGEIVAVIETTYEQRFVKLHVNSTIQNVTVSINNHYYTTPVTLTVEQGTTHLIAVEPSITVNETSYAFINWLINNTMRYNTATIIFTIAGDTNALATFLPVALFAPPPPTPTPFEFYCLPLIFWILLIIIFSAGVIFYSQRKTWMTAIPLIPVILWLIIFKPKIPVEQMPILVLRYFTVPPWHLYMALILTFVAITLLLSREE